jgi:hypothetical protein
MVNACADTQCSRSYVERANASRSPSRTTATTARVRHARGSAWVPLHPTTALVRVVASSQHLALHPKTLRDGRAMGNQSGRGQWHSCMTAYLHGRSPSRQVALMLGCKTLLAPPTMQCSLSMSRSSVRSLYTRPSTASPSPNVRPLVQSNPIGQAEAAQGRHG